MSMQIEHHLVPARHGGVQAGLHGPGRMCADP